VVLASAEEGGDRQTENASRPAGSGGNSLSNRDRSTKGGNRERGNHEKGGGGGEVDFLSLLRGGGKTVIFYILSRRE